MNTSSHKSVICYCGKSHANDSLGWTVVSCTDSRSRCGFLVYKRDVPADKAHYAADLAPFTHTSEEKARQAGRRGEFAYKKETV